jgi:NAD(P)-dependent dehydrogenase (short-subunit alcohol dehydrogenase family)
MADELKGKVVMVTGASGNVGSAIVKACADAGACIALVDRHAERIANIINTDLGGDTECYKGFPADLSDVHAVNTLVEHIVDQFTQIDALINTVGGFSAGDSVHAGKLDVFDKMMALNARTTYLVCGRVAKHMVDNIVHGSITTILARSGQKGMKNQAAYTASKAAATRIMESMALELRDHNIRVNGVSPSIVDTPPNRSDMPNADFDKWVKPSEIGALAVFLASDAASAISGANIEISGKS